MGVNDYTVTKTNSLNFQQSKLESGSHVLVNRLDIERLITEAMQIKEYLPKVSNIFK